METAGARRFFPKGTGLTPTAFQRPAGLQRPRRGSFDL